MSQHTCHATGCTIGVKPELLMCLKHWRMVPPELQRDVWSRYRKGQCDDLSPSVEYLSAARAAVVYVALSEGVTADTKLYDVMLERPGLLARKPAQFELFGLIFLQAPDPTWVKEYGWPAAILFTLIVALIFLARAIWPIVKSGLELYFTSLQRRADEAHELVKDLLQKAETRADEKTMQFLDALKEQRLSHEQGMRVQGELHAAAITHNTAAIKQVGDSVDILLARSKRERE